MPKVICQQCRTREVVTGRYMCRECEDQMTGRAPKPPKSESPSSGNGYSSASMPCRECGAALSSDDLFCPSCGSSRPRAASGRPSSAQAPPREDQTYQDPLFVGGVYRCPRCNAVLGAGSKRCAACGVMFMNPIPQARTSAGASAPRSGAARPQSSPPPSVCIHCQAPLDSNDEFCAACGCAQRHAAPDPHAQTGASAPSTDWKATAPPLMRVMSSTSFHKIWRGTGAVWSWGMLVLFLWSLWFVGSLVVHHFQSAGMNGVYVAEDGAGDMTFWPDGTYQMTAFGIELPGKYRIRNNDTVDMTAQYDSASNSNQQDHQADSFMGIFARGMDGEVSSDRNTFRWQGHTYSYDHRPTTNPPAVPGPSTPQTGSDGSPSAPSADQNNPGARQ